MTVAIVVSRADRASEHIGEHLLELGEWTEREDRDRPAADGGGTYYTTAGDTGAGDGAAFELRTFETLHLELPDAADAFADPDFLVFASRHSGETGPLLTAHFTGNFGPAEYGGQDRELAAACPNAHSRVLAAFAEHAPDGYEVGMECTHHGPSRVGVPSMFVELGSGPVEWDDPAGARAVARSILDLRGVAPTSDRTVVGFGGGHYAPRFTRIVRETPWSVGHVAADWCIEAMPDPASDAGRAVIDRVFRESGARHAVVDGTHPGIERAIADLGYRVVSETWVRVVGDRPLGLVAAVEDALGSVEDGTRFGRVLPEGTDVAEDGGGADAWADRFTVVDLPSDLLAEARGIDADAARDAVLDRSIAVGTVENGNRVTGPAALVDPEVRDAIVAELAAVLRTEYDTVEVRDDAVVAETTAFDPERARKLGVPEGPKFGRLSGGQPVEVDGETIPPRAVSVDRERRFSI